MKDDKLYLYHIDECISKIEKYLSSKTENHFLEDSLLQDAVIRNLQVLSESTQRLSDSIKEKYSAIEWFKISGFRNVVVHSYLIIDPKRIWLIIKDDIPPLKTTIRKMLAQK